MDGTENQWPPEHGAVEASAAAAVVDEAARLRVNVEKLLDMIGGRGSCRSCGARIWWVGMRSGKLNPFNGDATSHFATCPNADEHRKARV